MHPTIQTTLTRLEQLPLQSHGPITIIPLSDPTEHHLRYLTLAEALQTHRFRITEVSEGGSVPTLKAINQTEDNVLLIDGEEVAGAKQNRVFNASILVPAKSEITIPVSCTEQGRWSYRSPEFTDSGHVMSPRQRMDKKSFVTASLRNAGSFAGNQGSVWNEVRHLHDDLGTHSRTGAMDDAFAGRGTDIRALASEFTPLAGQVGLAAAVNGRLLGLDYVSQASVFEQVFPKLIRSYAVEALRTRSRHPGPQRQEDHDRVKVQYEQLVHLATGALETVHESVGLGSDHRYSSEALVGSALVHKEEVIHTAFFAVDQFGRPEPRDNFSSYADRRRFRF